MIFLNIFFLQKQPPEVFYKKGVLRNFTKFAGKHQCQSLFFNKVAGVRCFPVNFAKFLRTAFLQNSSGQLLLSSNKNLLATRTITKSKFHAEAIF